MSLKHNKTTLNNPSHLGGRFEEAEAAGDQLVAVLGAGDQLLPSLGDVLSYSSDGVRLVVVGADERLGALPRLYRRRVRPLSAPRSTVQNTGHSSCRSDHCNSTDSVVLQPRARL